MTRVPVLGVPVQSAALSGIDSLYSIVQMPGGVPVATFAIGKAGATNAGLFAAALIDNGDAKLAQKLTAWRDAQPESVALNPDSEGCVDWKRVVQGKRGSVRVDLMGPPD